MHQFLQVLLSPMQSIRIISVLFQPVQVLQQYFIVIYIQCPKIPNLGLECGELMSVVLLFVHSVFHAKGMLLILFQILLVFFPQRLFVGTRRL